MSPDPWTKYAWLDEERSDDLMAGCLGIAIGPSEATVRKHYAVDEGSRWEATVHEAWTVSTSDFGNDLLQIASVGAAVVTFEPNGWHGVAHELAMSLSRDGRYVAYFWNVNAVMQVIVAAGGAIQRDFDPLLYDSDEEDKSAPPEERDLPFPSGDDAPRTPARASLALIERLTGVEITRSWLLDEPHTTYRKDPDAHASSG